MNDDLYPEDWNTALRQHTADTAARQARTVALRTALAEARAAGLAARRARRFARLARMASCETDRMPPPRGERPVYTQTAMW